MIMNYRPAVIWFLCLYEIWNPYHVEYSNLRDINNTISLHAQKKGLAAALANQSVDTTIISSN